MDSPSIMNQVHSHVPVGNQGDAFYSKYCKIASTYHENAWVHIEKAIDSMDLSEDPEQPFVIANYGSSDGGTSLELIGCIVRKIREIYGRMKPIVVQYEDQSENDFVALFKILTGQIKFGNEESYFCKEENIFINACGVSFYNQCYPPSSIDLALSSTAFHWFKLLPPKESNSMNRFVEAFKWSDPYYIEAARKDWETLLLQRAKEMKPGARTVLIELARTDAGEYAGNTHSYPNDIHTVLHTCWVKIYEDKKITQEEFERPVSAKYFRSEAEHEEPFIDQNGAVARAGLRLLSMETRLTECSYQAILKANLVKDIKNYAQSYVNAMRSWSNHTLYSALSEERSEEEKQKILTDFYREYETLVVESPLEHGADYVHRYIVIEKIKKP